MVVCPRWMTMESEQTTHGRGECMQSWNEYIALVSPSAGTKHTNHRRLTCSGARSGNGINAVYSKIVILFLCFPFLVS